MARYDEHWRGFRGRGRYEEPYGPPSRYGRQGQGWEPYVQQADDDLTGIYGPARYGLGPYYERLLNRRRPDEELREEVEEALFYDTWVDAEAISVEVDDGIITLRGSLPSYEEIRYATDDAWDVDGVRGVRSELTIRER